MSFPRSIPTFLACAPLLVLASCVPVSESNPRPTPIKHTPEPVVAVASMNVSPLTRIGFDSAGVAAIFLHLEMHDAGGASIKAYGQLHVELYQPGVQPPARPPTAGQPPTNSSTWDADLRDPVRNTLTYDELITHTYTINLTGIPEWLVHWARHEGDMAAAAAPIIVAQFQPKDGGAAFKTTYTLTR